MTHTRLVSLAVVAGLLVVAAPAVSANEVTSTKIQGVLQLPETSGKPLYLDIALLKLKRERNGDVAIDSAYQGNRHFLVSILPGQGGKQYKFDFEIQEAAEGYQLAVELLDKNGDPSKSGTYLFDYPELQQQWGEKLVTLSEGQKSLKIDLPLRWVPRDPEKANTLALFRQENDYQVSFYYMPDAR
jgi:hypothetical protein